jgi:hypothetical protein
MDTLEAIRATAGSETGRATFAAQHVPLYEAALTLYHQQGQNKEAFFTAERGRARTFLDSLATGYVQLKDNQAANLLRQEQEAYAHRQAIQDNLAKAKAQKLPDKESDRYLLQDYSLVMLPSTSALRFVTAQEAQGSRVEILSLPPSPHCRQPDHR